MNDLIKQYVKYKQCTIRERAEPSDCWQTSCFPGKLEESNTGSVGLTFNTGLSAQSYLHSIPEGYASPTGAQSGTTEGHGIRGTRDAGQGGYRISPRNKEPTTVHIKYVPSTQERGPVHTRYKPQSSKSICTATTFQNGGYSNVKRSGQTRRLASQGGSERCLFYHPYPPRSQSFPKVPA